ncbi:hypothetical protein [Pararhodospirillum oryzae]|uniref:hypothetical protein n=1 Tax=Pararhodospirillum oryzae TaxID=478448 RepID=UPI0011BE30D4|nr:hypothetical protein [Pararhodospirillum oryzae]
MLPVLSACGVPVFLVADPVVNAGLGLDRDALREDAQELTDKLNANLAVEPDLESVTVIAALDRRPPSEGMGRVCYLVASGDVAREENARRLRERLQAWVGSDCRGVVNLSQVSWPGSPRTRGSILLSTADERSVETPAPRVSP